ncbi:hypothetical protein OBBRIDRAFT_890135 [Obba rivulosa]|uniref:Uncharacterized protein n=1 Tax=Obba rivulosa TaxID=1052685 RepID=A0A8E2ARS3_9APHY|nr:hypothetical protein OBBRIDRAFT_890135 [Obba rivulosa]
MPTAHSSHVLTSSSLAGSKTSRFLDPDDLKPVPDKYSEEDHREWDKPILDQLLRYGAKPEHFQSSVDDSQTWLHEILRRTAFLYDPERIASDVVDGLCEHPEIRKLIAEGLESRSFRYIRCLKLFREQQSDESLDVIPDQSQEDQKTAMINAWKTQFRGKAYEVLLAYILLCCRDPDLFALLLPIIQSTGSGKSRMVYEYSLDHFVIPINLDSGEGSFPPPDVALRDWLQKETQKRFIQTIERNSSTVVVGFRPDGADTFYEAFLVSLFHHIQHIISSDIGALIANDPTVDQAAKDEALRNLPRTIAAQFSAYMSMGQSFETEGELRKGLYAKVIRTAQVISEEPVKIDPQTDEILYHVPVDEETTISYTLLDAARQLLETLIRRQTPNISKSDMQKILTGSEPVLTLTFDEARQMSEYVIAEDGTYWSRFTSLRRVLGKLRLLPIWSFFLSTTGPLNQFSPPVAIELLTSVKLGQRKLVKPFCALGLDTMVMEEDLFDEDNPIWTLSKVASIEYWVKLGRPYWAARYQNSIDEVESTIVRIAAQKLLMTTYINPTIMRNLTNSQKLAILASRLALQFNSIPMDPLTRVRGDEFEQVERHMRMCLAIDEGFLSLLTVAPSEPTVVEGAAWLMHQDGFESCSALHSIFSNMPSISKGDRGEFVAANILLEALDNCSFVNKIRERYIVPVVDFMKGLLRNGPFEVLMKSRASSGDGDETFEELFKDSKMYITHFIKIIDRKVLTQEMLLRCIVRGAAIICADCQDCVDLILPFIIKGERLIRTNVSLVAVQVKNNLSYRRNPHRSLFNKMDPTYRRMKIFPKDFALPVIRMVFALEAQLAENFSDETADTHGHNIIVLQPPQRSSSRIHKQGNEAADGPVEENGSDEDGPADGANAGVDEGPRENVTANQFKAFDLWCCGASSQTFATIRPEQDRIYRGLLEQVSKAQEITKIEDPMIREAIMSQYPGATSMDESWSRFIKIRK